jgi:hypothetical protein
MNDLIKLEMQEWLNKYPTILFFIQEKAINPSVEQGLVKRATQCYKKLCTNRQV